METMWEAMKVTALGDIGWALTWFVGWCLWKMFFAKTKTSEKNNVH